MSFKIEMDVTGVQRAERTVDRSAQKINRSFRTLNNSTLLVEKAIKDLKGQFSSSMQQMASSTTKATTKIQKDLKQTANIFGSFGKTIKSAALGYATVLATMKIQEFVTGTFEAGVALDSLSRSFIAITGSTSGAARELAFLDKTASDLGLSLPTLEQSYKGILAASKGTSLEGERIRKVFTAVSKASAVLGMSADDTAGTLRALSQMISKGNVQAEELRGQLGERLPGAFQMAAEAMGVTTQRLNKMLEDGEVLASEMLPKLADVLESRFGKAALTAKDRAQGIFAEMGNSMLKFQRALMSSGILEYFVQAAKAATVMTDAATDFIQGLDAQEQIDLTSQQIINLERQKKAFQETGREVVKTAKQLSWFQRIQDALAQQKRIGAEPFKQELHDLAFAAGAVIDPIDKINKQLTELYALQGRQENLLFFRKQTKALEEINTLEEEQIRLAKALNKEAEPPEMKLPAKMRANREKFAQEILLAEMVKDQRLDLFESTRKNQADIDKEIARRYKKQHEDEMRMILKEAKATKDLNLIRLEDLRTLEISPLGPITDLEKYIEGLEETYNATQMMSDITITAFESMGDALTNFVKTGELDFRSFANSIIDEMIRMFVQAQVIKPMMEIFSVSGGGDGILSTIGSLFGFANGGIATGSSLSSASSSIISEPTFFPGSAPSKSVNMFANGGSLVGEGGRSEGILPLTRIGKDLGVKADLGGSATPIINIEVVNNVSDKAETQVTTRRDEFGNTVIGIIVDAAVNNKGGFKNVIKGIANSR